VDQIFDPTEITRDIMHDFAATAKRFENRRDRMVF